MVGLFICIGIEIGNIEAVAECVKLTLIKRRTSLVAKKLNAKFIYMSSNRKLLDFIDLIQGNNQISKSNLAQQLQVCSK